MIRTLLQQAVPSALLGAPTAFAPLERLERALESPAPSAETLEAAKADLHQTLRARFAPTEAQALTLKAVNIFLAKRSLRDRAATVASKPIGLVVDPSNTCRLSCPGCVHSKPLEDKGLFDWQNGTLQLDRFQALLRRFGPYAVGVYFCDYGEPLLNLQTPRLIEEAKRHLLGVMLSTSLSVKKLDAEAYVRSGLDFMVMSIDGATQEVYQKFRRNGELDLVFANIGKLVAARRALGRKTPTLSWNFLAFEHNVHEIPAARRIARELGVDQFRVVEPFDVSWDDPSIRPARVTPQVHRLNWLSLSHRPENWNPFPDRLAADVIDEAFRRPLTPPRPPAASAGHACHWLYKNMIMDANGRILPCCGAPRPDRDLVFARFEEGSPDPYNTEKYQAARAHFTGRAPQKERPHCIDCEWDQETVNIGAEEIRRYFRAADAGLFDRRSRDLLSNW